MDKENLKKLNQLANQIDRAEDHLKFFNLPTKIKIRTVDFSHDAFVGENDRSYSNEWITGWLEYIDQDSIILLYKARIEKKLNELKKEFENFKI